MKGGGGGGGGGTQEEKEEEEEEKLSDEDEEPLRGTARAIRRGLQGADSDDDADDLEAEDPLCDNKQMLARVTLGCDPAPSPCTLKLPQARIHDTTQRVQ